MFRRLAIGNEKLTELTDGDIKDIQRVLLGMIDDFDAFCRKHSLTYFLCGGTALGAVRHGGFIPWDEDADIGMPRRDFEKFRKAFTAEYGDKYHLQSIYTGEKYDLAFMKVRKKGTKYIELFETEPESAGIFIDIYPLDNLPDNAVLRFFHGAVSDFLFLCCSCVRVKEKKERFLDYLQNKKAIRLIKLKAFLGTLIGFYSLNKWCRIADRWSSKCKNENSRYVSYPSGRKHYFGEKCTRASYYPKKEISFEGRPLYIMNDPHEYLTALYGDYMEIPPVDARERHTVLTLDLGENDEEILCRR